MNPRRIPSLLVLNGLLLMILAVVILAPRLAAQSARIRGEYSMVAGNVKNAQSSVLYIVDSLNQDLVCVHWDINAKTLNGLAYRDLNADAATLRNTRN